MNKKLLMAMLCMTIASVTTLKLFPYTDTLGDKIPDRGPNVNNLGAEAEEQNFINSDYLPGCKDCDYNKEGCNKCRINNDYYDFYDVRNDL